MKVPANLIGLPLGVDSSVGGPEGFLSSDEITEFVRRALTSLDVTNKKVLLIVPDATRSCPMPLLLPLIQEHLCEAASITALIALGTHAAMTDVEINNFFAAGKPVADLYPAIRFINHEWWKPETFNQIGLISSEQLRDISVGRLDREVPVLINKLVTDSDLVLIVGPVFPHEVVGFSGGAKYLFPGVSGKQMIDTSHWLGALISSSEIIGATGITPVREMINTAASFVETDLYALCLVVQSGTGHLEAISFAKPHSAWELASAISAKTHINYLKTPVKRVLSIIPERYADIWTAAKGMYKVEPVIADGGEVIIYAPHVTEFAYTHPELEEIGYHCREFFTKQWDKYAEFPTGLLAHSTHLRGAGTFDEDNGEQLRITVTLATGISEARVRAMNLNYLDPATLNISDYENDSETMVLPNAGEILYRLES
jgi:nickel-dependent lactate racemase